MLGKLVVSAGWIVGIILGVIISVALGIGVLINSEFGLAVGFLIGTITFVVGASNLVGVFVATIGEACCTAGALPPLWQ